MAFNWSVFPATTTKRERGSQSEFQMKEYDPSGSGYAPRIKSEDWEEHRAFIIESHENHRSRIQIQEDLKERGFVVSLSQLHSKMGNWELKVYNHRKPNPLPTSDLTASSSSRKDEVMPVSQTVLDPQLLPEIDSAETSTPQGANIDMFMELPLFDCEEFEDYLQDSLLKKDPLFDLQHYINVVEKSKLAVDMQTTGDWSQLIIREVRNNSKLTNCSKWHIYTLIGDFFDFSQWPSAGFILLMERHKVLKALILETPRDSAEHGYYSCLFLPSLVACCHHVIGPKSTDLETFCSLYSDLSEFDTTGSKYVTDDARLRLGHKLQETALDFLLALFRLDPEISSPREYLKYLKILYRFKSQKNAKSWGLGRMGTYILKYFDRPLHNQITAAARAKILRKWKQDCFMLSDLLGWCDYTMKISSASIFQTEIAVNSRPLDMREPVFITVLTHFLKEWFSESGYENDGTQHRFRDIRGLHSPKCPCCLQKLVRRLASISLLAVSNGNSVPLKQAKGISSVSPHSTIFQTVSDALENIRTMRSTELRFVYYESRDVSLYSVPEHIQFHSLLENNYSGDFLTNSIGIFATAFGRYLSDMLLNTAPNNFLPCGAIDLSIGATESTKSSMIDDSSSVSSGRSRIDGTMRRIKRRGKVFLSSPSAESFVSLILGDRSPTASHSSNFLSSALSLLSLGTARSVSTINSVSTIYSNSSGSII